MDLIDRQAAIDALWKALYEDEDKTEKQFQESEVLDVRDWIDHRIFVQNMNDIDRQTILNLPSVQPEPLTLSVNSELTKEEYDKLMQDIKDAPIVLLPSEQPDRKTGEWLYDLLQDAIDDGIITEVQAVKIMDHKGDK